ncbi:type VII toxin-antitoxin system MntA family adenylyltransferase antitoxin [Desulfosarcina ovata]|uniref:Toxin-antitoxin system antidote Mnt family protein n=2 Tax=Desulfosarcina ovata TaxID=83564 RepID=A0A5K8A5B8_9BACT|nr:nucleotidyltransferase domain-containing protein [Desulfosarcina ovata]BBO80287.1 toxin-antitoxin system antidote Mnt family protein [Desulfosarcina ovata subsp. sediminis]BBO87677.1 toxin-antitoxin system antidote Mnt family protein [Desulfosarcina ovata subsp. ovata]
MSLNVLLNSQLQKELIEEICSTVHSCVAIYRFGSWGTAAQRKGSDIDIAVLAASPLDPVGRWDLAQKLASIAGRDVDLVDLLRASTVLRMQVVAYGERLHCVDAEAAERFEDNVFSSYAKLNEERRLILEDVNRRGSVYDQ